MMIAAAHLCQGDVVAGVGPVEEVQRRAGLMDTHIYVAFEDDRDEPVHARIEPLRERLVALDGTTNADNENLRYYGYAVSAPQEYLFDVTARAEEVDDLW